MVACRVKTLDAVGTEQVQVSVQYRRVTSAGAGAIPEEEAQPSSAGEGVGGAGAHVLPVHLCLTAVALRTQHTPTDQTQRGSPRLIPPGPRTPGGQEDRYRTGVKHQTSPLLNS